MARLLATDYTDRELTSDHIAFHRFVEGIREDYSL